MLPGVLFFVFFDIVQGRWGSLVKHILSLSMLQNFGYPVLKITPAVYWYFSLTFQLYIVFLLLRNHLQTLSLLLLSIVFFIASVCLDNTDYTGVISIYRHCFPGWFPLFAVGVFFAKQIIAGRLPKIPHSNAILEFLLTILLLVLIVLMNISYASWIFVPFMALVMFFIMTKLILRSDSLTKLFRWIGIYSACIFVCHPIARMLIFTFNLHRFGLLHSLIIYISMSMILAFYYQKLYISLKTKYIR